jgi:AraC family transcriptional regulator, transcriptional activator FtrA
MAKPRLVVSIIHNELWTFDFAMTTVFALPWPEGDFQPYRFVVASTAAGPIRAFGEIDVHGYARIETARQADLLIVPGWGGADEVPSPVLLDIVRVANARGARIAALGVGVFVLAHAGVLHGKRAATHWYLSAKLARDFPDVRVARDSLYVQDGNVYTSAGCLSGIDMLLTIIRQDYGVRVANRYARRLIAPPHRDGTQNQLAAFRAVTKTANPISRVIEWMEKHLAEKITVPMLADRAAMSPRTFMRRFQNCIGRPPLQWLTLRRISAAQELLEESNRSMDWIAAATGFGTAELLRYHFRKSVGISPAQWRQAKDLLGSNRRKNRPNLR